MVSNTLTPILIQHTVTLQNILDTEAQSWGCWNKQNIQDTLLKFYVYLLIKVSAHYKNYQHPVAFTLELPCLSLQSREASKIIKRWVYLLRVLECDRDCVHVGGWGQPSHRRYSHHEPPFLVFHWTLLRTSDTWHIIRINLHGLKM